MTQIRMARAGLWLLLVGVPILYYLLPSWLFALLGLAYCMGCLVHLLVPAWLSNPPVVPQAVHHIISEEYWYPYYGWPLQPLLTQGWTIYAPIDVSF